MFVLVNIPAQTWCSFSHCIGLGKTWCLTVIDLLKITFDSPDVVLLLILSVFSLLSHSCTAWPVAWCGFAQVPGRLGCHQRSNRHRVSLYKFPGEGDHVSRVHKAALHRGRFPAGIRRRSEDYNSVAGRGGLFEGLHRGGNDWLYGIGNYGWSNGKSSDEGFGEQMVLRCWADWCLRSHHTVLLFFTCLLSSLFLSSPASAEASHWEWYCSHHFPGWKHTFCPWYDCF